MLLAVPAWAWSGPDVLCLCVAYGFLSADGWLCAAPLALACTCLQEEKDERLFLEFGLFESNNREHERARIIYKFGLDSLPKHLCQDLYKQYVSFEKQHGDQKNIEDVIVDKRRTQYEDAVAANPHNYDAWFDYIRLEESEANLVRHLRMVCCVVVDLCPVPPPLHFRSCCCVTLQSSTPLLVVHAVAGQDP